MTRELAPQEAAAAARLTHADSLSARGAAVLSSGAVVAASGRNDLAWRTRVYDAMGMSFDELRALARAWRDVGVRG